MRHRIAVIIPAYNAERFVARALESAASQSRRPDQIIVVDDGSTDRTPDRVREWMRQTGAAVDLVEQANGGVACARNAGLRVANADLVSFLDADDYVCPNHLETLEPAYMRYPGLVLSFGMTREIDVAGDEIKIFPDRRVNQAISHADGAFRILTRDSVYRTLIQGSYITVSATLVSRRAAEELGGMDESLPPSEDCDFWLRLSRLGVFAYAPTIVSTKLTHGENATHPKNALRTDMSKLRALRKMISCAAELRLDPGDVAATRSAARVAAADVLYEASRRGLRTYCRALSEVTRGVALEAAFEPRHFVRALCSSLDGRLTRWPWARRTVA